MTDTITNWNELDYSVPESRIALRWAIAEAQGWSVKERDNYFILYAPDGLVQCLPKETRYELLYFLPKYDDNLIWADALLDNTPGIGLWQIDTERSMYGQPTLYTVSGLIMNGQHIARVRHTNKCIARCLAYLMYVARMGEHHHD